MSVWTENITAEFHQKILSGCLKICKIRQGITLFCRTLYMWGKWTPAGRLAWPGRTRWVVSQPLTDCVKSRSHWQQSVAAGATNSAATFCPKVRRHCRRWRRQIVASLAVWTSHNSHVVVRTWIKFKPLVACQFKTTDESFPVRFCYSST